MLKKIIYILICIAVFIGLNIDLINDYGKTAPDFADITQNFSWATAAIDELSLKGAVSGISENIFAPSLPVSKEQLAKMLAVSFSLDSKEADSATFSDVTPNRWSYGYIEAVGSFFPKSSLSPDEFNPEAACTRETLAATVANILNLPPSDTAFLAENYQDADSVSSETAGLLSAAVNAGILSGADGLLSPKREVTRAEACVILKRALECRENGTAADINRTSILGEAQISVDNAQKWAKSKNADERFINIAPLYWEYGEKTGIRPEVLYAQAAKETNYGKYTGNVVPEQNNWAGIKTVTASGDKTYDHETFESPEDGVRGHFNHMCAYVGLAPVGEPHERFSSTVTAAWAGTVKFVEDLGGKWAPAGDYGESIVNDYMKPMSMAK